MSPVPVTLSAGSPEHVLNLDAADMASDLTLSLVINDADVAGEGRLTMGNWSTLLFDGQLGPDAQDHTVTYTIPKEDAADGRLTFQHLSTNGYVVVSGTGEYDVESVYSNELTKIVEALPDPPSIVVGVVCNGCEERQTNLWIGLTGEAITLTWDPAGAETVEVEVLEYPAKAGAIPVAQGTFTTSTTWDWVPSGSELFYSRVRGCTAGVCGEWANSYEQGWLYYVRLAPAGEGGID